jgi:hypothetical protein
MMFIGVGTQKATWCSRGPTPCVKGHVVDPALAVQPGRPEPGPVLVLGVLGHAKAHLRVEGNGGVHVVREAVEVIDP